LSFFLLECFEKLLNKVEHVVDFLHFRILGSTWSFSG
jgi:hypothetical protein